MKLRSKNRLLLAVTSTALAAAVLLTGCGGGDGGSNGGSDNNGDNSSTVEPAPDNGSDSGNDSDSGNGSDSGQQPEQPDPEPEATEEMMAPGQPATTESGVEMKVTTQNADNSVDTVAVKNDSSKVYVPFNFEIANNSENAIDLNETAQTTMQRARGLVSTFSAESEYDSLFDGNHEASNFTISLDGKTIRTGNTASTVQIYDKDGKEKSGTVMQPGESAKIKVVVKVPAEWADTENDLNKKPIKVEYALPNQSDDAQTVKYSFAVTAKGEAPSYTEVPTADKSTVQYNTVKATLNGKDGYLVVMGATVENTTNGLFDLRNTLDSVGGITVGSALNGVSADEIFKGTAAQNVTATVTTTKKAAEAYTIITAVDADKAAMAIMQKSQAYAYIFVPKENGQWTEIAIICNGKNLGSVKQTPVEEPAETTTAVPTKTNVKITIRPEEPQAVHVVTQDGVSVNGYVAQQMVMIENVSDAPVQLDGFHTYEEFMQVMNALIAKYQPQVEAEQKEAAEEVAELQKRNGWTDEEAQTVLYQKYDEIDAYYYDLLYKDGYKVAQQYKNTNVQVMSSSEAWCVTILSEQTASTTLQPGERVEAMIGVYTSEKSNLVGAYHAKQLFSIPESVLVKADADDSEEPSETPEEDWTTKEDEDKDIYTKYPTYFLEYASISSNSVYDDNWNIVQYENVFEFTDGYVRNTTADTVNFEHSLSIFPAEKYGMYDTSALFPKGDENRYVGKRMKLRVYLNNGKVNDYPCVLAVGTADGNLKAGAASKLLVAARVVSKDSIMNMLTKVELYDASGNTDYLVFRGFYHQYSEPSAQTQTIRNELRPVQ